MQARDENFLIDSSMVVHRLISDHHIYIVDAKDENPLVLGRALNCIAEAINILISRNPDSSFAFDEIFDQGILLEVDPNLIIDRVCLTTMDQSLTQVFQSAAEIRLPWV